MRYRFATEAVEPFYSNKQGLDVKSPQDIKTFFEETCSTTFRICGLKVNINIREFEPI